MTGAIPSVTSATRFPRSSSSTFGPSGSLRTFRSGSGLPSSRCNTFSRLRRSACLLRICLAPLRRFSLSVGAVPYSGNRASLKVFDGAGGSGYGRLAPNCRKLDLQNGFFSPSWGQSVGLFGIRCILLAPDSGLSCPPCGRSRCQTPFLVHPLSLADTVKSLPGFRFPPNTFSKY